MPPNGPTNHADLILRSQQGDDLALGELLESHRNWLKDTAAKELNGRAPARIDPSDIVQQTLLSAFNRFAQFNGTSSGEFAGWLKKIHERNIHDAVRRHLGASKRCVEQEQPIAGQLIADTDAESPSQHAIRQERIGSLSWYLGLLPHDQAKAVRLRYLDGKSLAQLAAEFDRSIDSVASLLKRGLENLRQRIPSE